jgi:hypothetical protein
MRRAGSGKRKERHGKRKQGQDMGAFHHSLL